MVDIGQRIKLKRQEMKMSQRELSSKMGYSNHSTITKIEAGTVDLPQSRIEQFAEVLNTSIQYLMGWDLEEEKEKPTEDDGLSENQRLLIQFAKSVPDEKAAMVLRVMKSILESDE